MRRTIACMLALLVSSAAGAEVARSPARTVQVMGTGHIRTHPGIATVHLFLAGEGRTPDEASAALEAKQSTILSAVTGFLDGHATATNSNLVLIEARDPKCDISNTPRLSQGACAVVGYVATLEDEIRTDRVEQAGTAAGLAGRLGARDARVSGFELADPAAAYRSAVQAAVADAHTQAALLAGASGARLGAVVAIRDQNSNWQAGDIVAEGIERVAPAPPPPPPVSITLRPQPIETQASVYVTYALAP